MKPNTENPLRALGGLGQSVWLDFIRRELIQSGELTRLIREDDVRGLTSNPAIFEKAMAGGAEYEAGILAGAASGMDVRALYESLAIEDIRAAADLMLAVHRESRGADGFVSLEVSPELAQDRKSTRLNSSHSQQSRMPSSA